MPYAFTMLGTAMLSSVLRSDTAIETNRKIMRAFVAYRHLAELPIAATYLELKKETDTKTRKPIGFIQPEDDDDKK